MKLIKPSFLIKEQEPGLEGIYKQIEWAGRHCYKSLDKITEDSAKEFVDRMIKLEHGAVLEHGTVYLNIHWENEIHEVFEDMFKFYNENPYSKIVRKTTNVEDLCPDLFISTNYRVLVEHNRLNDLKYLCEPTEYHEKRICVKFICDRGVSHEFVRHRVMSFAQESTRYCNYSKDKFNNEITCIIPCWLKINEGNYVLIEGEDYWGNSTGFHLVFNNNVVYEEQIPDLYKELMPFIESLKTSEKTYFNLLNLNWKPQQARAILPNALKTELVMTGFVSDWKHFFKLRCDSAAHPQVRELAIPLREEFIKRNLI